MQMSSLARPSGGSAAENEQKVTERDRKYRDKRRSDRGMVAGVLPKLQIPKMQEQVDGLLSGSERSPGPLSGAEEEAQETQNTMHERRHSYSRAMLAHTRSQLASPTGTIPSYTRAMHSYTAAQFARLSRSETGSRRTGFGVSDDAAGWLLRCGSADLRRGVETSGKACGAPDAGLGGERRRSRSFDGGR
ncbi:hypothetical protein LTR66_014505 [Elasticomyces elasticus]|nr:hypothetical protein LTR66_014505 [Elasticomyces elasticus]KAK5003622.1 hypothetical protein LTR28_009939 [Elasticomyces elasticus]